KEWLPTRPEKAPYGFAEAFHFLDLPDVHSSHHASRLSRTSHAARPSGTAGPAARHRTCARSGEISNAGARPGANSANRGHRTLPSDGVHHSNPRSRAQ